MQRIIFILFFISLNVCADTIDHFMNIVNNIPQMEMKADSESQAWARSARNILALTSESIIESLILANESATSVGKPLFCLPPGVQLKAEDMSSLIQQTYREMGSQQSDNNKMTVSQIALLGMSKKYACQQQNLPKEAFNQAMQQMVRSH